MREAELDSQLKHVRLARPFHGVESMETPALLKAIPAGESHGIFKGTLATELPVFHNKATMHAEDSRREGG